MVLNSSKLPEETKRELASILDKSKPEEAEKMVTNMEQTLGRMYEEGIEEGILEGKMKDARKMLAKNLSEDFIADITELPLEEIKKLKSEIAGETH
jgi:predicted transposase/invertase (TIGR01784 family)